MTDLERFQAKYYVDPETGCWVWRGASVPVVGKGTGRYGMFTWKGKFSYAHRFAQEWWRGPMPKGKVTDHRCRNTICVNPFHLEAVTQAENIRRGVRHQKKEAVALTTA